MSLFKSLRKILYDNFIIDIGFFGSMSFYLLVILFSYLFNYKVLSYIFVFNLLFIIVSISLIRLIYFKNRPDVMSYKNVIEKIDASSFPSIHSARVFSVFVTLYLSFNYSISIILIILVLALFTGYSRIYKKKHDCIDVLFGWLLGCLISLLSYYLFY